jgi:mono/diheme cytochrome c family protein
MFKTTSGPFLLPLPLLPLPLLTLLLASCLAAEPGGDSVAAETDTGQNDGGQLGPTWWQDVAPIYYDACVSCHRDGGIAPFSLADYEQASAWGSVAVQAVRAREMPPWLVTDDGTCNSWQHSPVLSQEQIDTIAGWVEQGMPEGTPRADLELPEQESLADTFAISTPEFVPQPEGGLLAKHDEYRCFSIDPAWDHDVFLTGYEVTPGNDALVHHVLAMVVDPSEVVDDNLTNMQVMQALDDESPDRLGWSCLGVAGEGVEIAGLPVSWAPGQGAVRLPASSGYRLPAGHVLVVQIHYNMFDASLIGQSDSTTLELQLADSVEREGLFDMGDGLIFSLIDGDPHVLPAGEPAYEYSWRFKADSYLARSGSDRMELWGFFPHMHNYGTKLTARLLDETGQEVDCVGEVPRWDFGWQIYYFMQQPIVLEPGYEIEVTCTYDTTTAPTDLVPGWGTFNEMCTMGVYVVAP